MKPGEKKLASAIESLIYCNPFLSERIEFEREALGEEFVSQDAAWNVRNDWAEIHPNVRRVQEKAAALVVGLRKGFGKRPPGGQRDRELYEAVALFHLFHRFCPELDQAVEAGLHNGDRRERVAAFATFRKDCDELFLFDGKPLFPGYRPEHLFAFFFQIRRAFFHIFRYLAGRSEAMARLRAAIWESIFTCDTKRFRRALYERMGDMPTLITGPTGTGKELVARAVGLSRFIPFDARSQTFEASFAGAFSPLNLSALSPTLLESELFGHRKGAFTGALQDRAGWLEACGPYGTVFLDEIGEVDAQVQVKLLRVLQQRTFARIGDTGTRRFEGKIVAATNRDLPAEMEKGTFREDFYYRLCSDVIHTPSLAEQVGGDAGELRHLVGFIAKNVVGESEAESFANDAGDWILRHLGADYRWPGNFRELEQCLRNFVIRGSYQPAKGGPPGLAERIDAGELTADEVLREYAKRLYSRCGSYVEVARKMDLDRRTVKKHLGRGTVDDD